MNKRIEITLNDFIDFVRKSGSPKLTKIKDIKSREPYSPATDFYKQIREAIIDFHIKKKEKNDLDSIFESINDKRKIPHFKLIIEGYKKFIGKKNIEWFTPKSCHWLTGNLDVKINPELGLQINGKQYILKLYFKAEKLTKERISLILALIHLNLNQDNNSEFEYAILDVRNNKIYEFEKKYLDLLPLLEGEARNFEEIWNKI